jgi:hypothetical protein
MDSKQLKRETDAYKKAKEQHRQEMATRDRLVHGEDSKVKYDPSTGTLKE